VALRGRNQRARTRRGLARGALCIVAASAVAAGCGGSDEAATPADVLADGGSVAQVTIDGVAYDFVVDCYDAGAGSVVVVGAGEEPDAAVAEDVEGDGERSETHILVQAYLGDSYLGVTVEPDHEGEPEVVYEASLDDELDLVLESDVIEADAITFVRNLDLATGDGATVGGGSLRVTCGGYEAGTPPGEDA
jgi:hypothetical protein